MNRKLGSCTAVDGYFTLHQ